MSLIHEALKKAEQEKNPAAEPRNFLSNPIFKKTGGPLKRTLALVVVLGLSLLFLIYMRWLRPGASRSVPQPAPPLTGELKIPDDPAAIKKLALDLYAQGRLEQASTHLEKLTLLLPTDAEIYNNLGLVLRKLGRKEEAYQAYARALALNKEYPEALNNLGVLYLNDGDREKAKNHFQEALRLKKDYADAALNLAIAFEQEGNPAKAKAHYQQFLSLAPDADKNILEKVERKIERLETK